MTFTVKVLFFASAKDATGISQTSLSLEDGAHTTTFRKVLATKYPSLADTVLDEDSLTLALNEEYVQTGAVISLKEGDTIALIPPISGG